LTLLAQRLSNAGSDPETLLRILQPVAMTPSVLISVLLMVSGVVPLIEELVKPLGLWVLVGKKLTPAQGFVGGLLCGAAFALLESLGSMPVPRAGMAGAGTGTHRHRNAAHGDDRPDGLGAGVLLAG